MVDCSVKPQERKLNRKVGVKSCALLRGLFFTDKGGESLRDLGSRVLGPETQRATCP